MLDPELPFKKSKAKGGTMIIWKKWMDPYITIHNNVHSSSFQAMILSLPNYETSIHVSVYLPTSGKDQEFTNHLTDLYNCLEELVLTYPNAKTFLRGDFNVNPNNTTRSIQLNAFQRAFRLMSVCIPHKTYHHFVGQGRFDSAIDLLLYPINVPGHETLSKVICKFDFPEISSHHDMILSNCKLLMKVEEPPRSQVLKRAPRTEVERPRVS